MGKGKKKRMNKRLIGGLVLLNLLNLNLHSFASEDDIEDVDILNQLTELRTFIDENRNYTKGAKELKPVLVQYRDATAKIDGVVQCNMCFDTDALHLSICGTSMQKDGTQLKIIIKVVYEYTQYVGYTIKTATLVANKELPLFEDIVDKNGNKRFIEGDLTTNSEISGITFTYGKWVLSGTHLMIVLCGTIANGTQTTTVEFASATLPDYIKDKIIPVFATSYIAINNDNAYADDWTSQSIQNALKTTNDGVSIQHIDSHEFTANRSFRIQYDLVIDDEVIE